jgi:hypothetical protein
VGLLLSDLRDGNPDAHAQLHRASPTVRGQGVRGGAHRNQPVLQTGSVLFIGGHRNQPVLQTGSVLFIGSVVDPDGHINKPKLQIGSVLLIGGHRETSQCSRQVEYCS